MTEDYVNWPRVLYGVIGILIIVILIVILFTSEKQSPPSPNDLVWNPNWETQTITESFDHCKKTEIIQLNERAWQSYFTLYTSKSEKGIYSYPFIKKIDRFYIDQNKFENTITICTEL